MFEFVRSLSGCTDILKLSSGQLRPALETWATIAQRVPGWSALTVDEALRFVPPWDRIRFRPGTSRAWTEVESAAEEMQLPITIVEVLAGERFARQNKEFNYRFCKLCLAASRKFGPQPFGLDCRRVMQFIGCASETTANKLRRRFEKLGWLKRKSDGSWKNHHCETFLWTGPTN